MDAFINLQHLLCKYCKHGYAFVNFDDIADFVKQCGGSIYRDKYNNWPTERSMILSMNHTQAVADYDAFAMYIGNYGISIVFDGHKIGRKGITLFRARGYNVTDQIEQRYMTIYDLKKVLYQDENDDLLDLLTIETGRDIYEMVKKLIYEKLQANFSSVNSITADGKSAHFGDSNGIFFLYLFFFFSYLFFPSFADILKCQTFLVSFSTLSLTMK